jgi:predicted DNA-binding protein with PD1-like motif
MIPIRLTTGTDLKLYLSNLAKDETLFPKDTGFFIATCVGSLTQAKLRMAGAKSFLEVSSTSPKFFYSFSLT